MDLHSVVNFCKDFYYSHPLAALVIAVILLFALIFRTMEVLKIVGVIMLMALAVYIFSLMGDSFGTGMSSKKRMINQTINRME